MSNGGSSGSHHSLTWGRSSQSVISLMSAGSSLIRRTARAPSLHSSSMLESCHVRGSVDFPCRCGGIPWARDLPTEEAHMGMLAIGLGGLAVGLLLGLTLLKHQPTSREAAQLSMRMETQAAEIRRLAD